MSDRSPRVTPRPASVAAGDDVPAPGVVGIGLAAVLTFALAQGSWQWFATFIGVTLLAVMIAFQRRAEWTPDIRSAYMRGLIAYALVVGLCVAIALAPLLQRRAWLFPMPGTRSECELAGRYEAPQVKAALGNLAGSDGAALAFAQEVQARKAVAECLAATTTLWLPLYGLGAAVLVGAAAWLRDRARARGRAGHGAAGR
ncbi:hypothetical protein OG784_01095 [Streptomyces sp. NBC_01617]|uniref:hypothetical protein n=1 Tax=Streptomyces sp. NBC_01617 TaxID=2975899 RepID=UPI003868612B|nr:hypothetical protein OG784_01095 [Streptomyces sp. NBC_01617]